MKIYKIGLVSMMALLVVAGVGVLPSAFAAPSPSAVNLGAAGNFAILSQTGITDSPPGGSTITGNIGASPITGAAITGVACAQVAGIIYTVDAAGPACSVIDTALLSTAVSNMQAAYTDAAGRACGTSEGVTDLSGLTFTTGVYCWTLNAVASTSFTISGSSSDVFIFKIPGGLTVSSGVHVTLSGGASASNIFWVVGGVVALQGPSTAFQGIILAGPTGSITMTSGATLTGRALSQTDVTLISNTITAPSAAVSPPPPHQTHGCTVTYSSSSPPPTSLIISASGTYCFTSGETFNTQIQVFASDVTLTNTGGRQLATIQPSAVAATTASSTSHLPLAPIILVQGVTQVDITQLIIDGSVATSSIKSCSPNFIGIMYQGASGSIEQTTVQNIYDSPSTLGGCQSGLGIFVQTPTGGSSVVSITQNTVTNYNKNGITCNEVGTICTIDSNTVSFYAAEIPYIAPNGIQVGYGAVGTVTDNTVSGNQCTLAGACGPNLITLAQGTGILTYESGARTSVTGNTLKGNDLGIALYCDSVSANQNTVQSSGDVGIVAYDGTYQITNNVISTSPIGISMVSDGTLATSCPGVSSATGAASATIQGNNLHVTLDGQIITQPPGTFTMSCDSGFTETVTGNAIVNVASFGGSSGPGGPH